MPSAVGRAMAVWCDLQPATAVSRQTSRQQAMISLALPPPGAAAAAGGAPTPLAKSPPMCFDAPEVLCKEYLGSDIAEKHRRGTSPTARGAPTGREKLVRQPRTLQARLQLGGTVSGPACRGENLWAAVLQDVCERRALFRGRKLIEEIETRSREV